MFPVACAFHSPHVAAAQQRFSELLAQEAIAPARVPVYSNITGDAHPDEAEAITALLSEHLIRRSSSSARSTRCTGTAPACSSRSGRARC